MVKDLKQLIPNDINKDNNGKSIFYNLCFIFFLCIMIFFDFLMFKSFNTWMAPLIIFLLEVFILEILSKLLKITEAPIIIRLLLYIIKDKNIG